MIINSIPHRWTLKTDITFAVVGSSIRRIERVFRCKSSIINTFCIKIVLV